MAEIIFYLVIVLFVASFMLGIGIYQLHSKKPVGFYSGETPPRKEQLKSVEEWNKKHGMMWVLYGMTIIVTSVIGCFFIHNDSLFILIPVFTGLCLPIVIMIWYHHKLIKDYVIR